VSAKARRKRGLPFSVEFVETGGEAVSLKARLNRLENRHGGPSCCPECRRPDAAYGTIVEHIMVRQSARGEPVGYYYELDGRRHPYPPDPRRLCPACGRRVGLLFLTAVYDGDVWEASTRIEGYEKP
jgi:hypothetical protein